MKSRTCNFRCLGVFCGAALLLLPLSVTSAAQSGQTSPDVPLVQIRFPFDHAVVSGTAMIEGHQINTTFGPSLINSIIFEHSPDGGTTWALIDNIEFLGDETMSQDIHDSVVYWDTSAVSSGSYLIRARYITALGQVVTPPVHITVKKPPVAVATKGFVTVNYVELSGSGSYAPDGSIVSWDWDFGDGTHASGSQVTHTYAPGVYTAVLTVTDNDNFQSSDYLIIDTAGQQVAKQRNCIGKKIMLGVDGKAEYRNPRFMKGDWWFAWPPGIVKNLKGESKFDNDGFTLGPLSTNPLHQTPYYGYAFEMRVEVEGKPSACKEIQILKKTTVTKSYALSDADCLALAGGRLADPGICYYDSGWTGKTSDFDEDGTIDLDLSTQEKCEDQRGKWNKLTNTCENAAFPLDGTAFKPDEAKEGEVDGAYRAPFDFKKYVGKMIYWWDAPETADEGSQVDANFVAIIRSSYKRCGANAKDYCYCYVDFNVSYKVGTAGSEKITENSKACEVDKSKVPGLK